MTHTIIAYWPSTVNGSRFTIHESESLSDRDILWSIDALDDPSGTEYVCICEADMPDLSEDERDALSFNGYLDAPRLEEPLKHIWERLMPATVEERLDTAEREAEELRNQNQDLLIRIAELDARELTSKEVRQLIGTVEDTRPRYVYLMKDKANGLYKIGKSIDPKHRERTLQSEKPSIHMVFSAQERDDFNEKSLHRRYAEHRKRGEWFSLTPAQVRFICHYRTT
jgi:hypothetical protein